MKRARQRLAHGGIVVLSLVPIALLAIRGWYGHLGANPVETVTHETGQWTLRFLVASLAVTPLRKLIGWPRIAPYRRTLGLLAFTYACLHVSTYVALDLTFDLRAVGEDVARRPYIAVGFAAFSLLVPLAATSTRAIVRRLGRRWVTLHRLVYLAAFLGVVHFLWLVKADLRGPLVYAGVLSLLLGVRLWWRVVRARSRTPREVVLRVTPIEPTAPADARDWDRAMTSGGTYPTRAIDWGRWGARARRLP